MPRKSKNKKFTPGSIADRVEKYLQASGILLQNPPQGGGVKKSRGRRARVGREGRIAARSMGGGTVAIPNLTLRQGFQLTSTIRMDREMGEVRVIRGRMPLAAITSTAGSVGVLTYPLSPFDVASSTAGANSKLYIWSQMYRKFRFTKVSLDAYSLKGENSIGEYEAVYTPDPLDVVPNNSAGFANLAGYDMVKYSGLGTPLHFDVPPNEMKVEQWLNTLQVLGRDADWERQGLMFVGVSNQDYVTEVITRPIISFELELAEEQVHTLAYSADHPEKMRPLPPFRKFLHAGLEEEEEKRDDSLDEFPSQQEQGTEVSTEREILRLQTQLNTLRSKLSQEVMSDYVSVVSQRSLLNQN